MLRKSQEDPHNGRYKTIPEHISYTKKYCHNRICSIIFSENHDYPLDSGKRFGEGLDISGELEIIINKKPHSANQKLKSKNISVLPESGGR